MNHTLLQCFLSCSWWKRYNDKEIADLICLHHHQSRQHDAYDLLHYRSNQRCHEHLTDKEKALFWIYANARDNKIQCHLDNLATKTNVKITRRSLSSKTKKKTLSLCDILIINCHQNIIAIHLQVQRNKSLHKRPKWNSNMTKKRHKGMTTFLFWSEFICINSIVQCNEQGSGVCSLKDNNGTVYRKYIKIWF